MTKFLLKIIFISLLTGCANRQFVEPMDSHVATLEFVNKISDPDLFYYAFTYKEIKQCTNRQYIAYMEKEKNKIIKIKSDEPIVITSIIPQPIGLETLLVGSLGAIGALASGVTYSECKPTLEFTPKENYRYRLMMGTNKNGCEFSFTEIDPSNNVNPSFKFVSRKWKKAFTDDGSWCE